VRRPIAATACTVSAVVTLTGCGRERIAPPDTLRPAPPAGSAPESFPQAGVRLDRPGNWPFAAGKPPLVASASSGTATVALWRYVRSEPLPRGDAALDAAETALEDAAKVRDATFALDETRRLKVDGEPAIQLLGDETVAGQKRRVRSTHVYAQGAEIVLDAYAAAGEFARVDREVFEPMIGSLRIGPATG
jgi:hypothetical protein